MSIPDPLVAFERALTDAALAALAGRVNDAVSIVRAAIAKVPRHRRIELHLPHEIWAPLIVPVMRRLDPATVLAHFGKEWYSPEEAERALADLWLRAAAGEIGFDA